ncbi:winged helix-turn-helix domain-containing protein [Nonomuraea angiospora]|uniref:ArsR/SmtB family transcription factor n=1 Tax=Nonomuraea angiospora TaxID=46172 RepID=UPI00344EC438
MWEIVLSVQLLQNREGPLLFDSWRHSARTKVQPWIGPLLTLAPHAQYFPDFLTPLGPADALEEEVEAILATPRARIRAELELLGTQSRLPSWTHRLANGDIRVLDGLGRALRSYHDAVLQSEWPAVQAHIEADRSKRMRAFTDGGVEGLLRSYSPLLRWNPPFLETDYPVPQELVLGGRGLLLLPSYFCCRMPVTLADPDLRPVLVYPVAREVHDRLPCSGNASLAALIGRTRAVILRSIGNGCSTTELSRRAGTSIASASQHTIVLREAGLITTQRHGNAVLHSLTPLGWDLLQAKHQPN